MVLLITVEERRQTLCGRQKHSLNNLQKGILASVLKQVAGRVTSYFPLWASVSLSFGVLSCSLYSHHRLSKEDQRQRLDFSRMSVRHPKGCVLKVNCDQKPKKGTATAGTKEEGGCSHPVNLIKQCSKQELMRMFNP